MTYREVLLTQRKVALVDAEDYERVMDAGPWHAVRGRNVWYAKRTVRREDGKQTAQPMHRFLLGVTDPKVCVDHINHDGLDNRLSNLRLATTAQNLANRRTPTYNKSGFLGVTWNRRNGKWTAHLSIDGRRRSLGTFNDVRTAAMARDYAALQKSGEFASLNFPTTDGPVDIWERMREAEELG